MAGSTAQKSVSPSKEHQKKKEPKEKENCISPMTSTPSSAPRRFVPDDAVFARSLQLMETEDFDTRQLRLAALATLPTPVAPDQCFRMWIPAPDVVNAHNLEEILQSLAGSQVQTWKDARPHVRDFARIPKHGISFVCTSSNVCHKLGGVALKICGHSVTIRKYSLYDKWYYVDLSRIPSDIDDTTIYNWFCDKTGARPVLIAPKYQASGLVSRDRTVFFPHVGCPDGLFIDEKTPLREIFFSADQTVPCYVNHRIKALNKYKPPSLKKAPKTKRHIELSDLVPATGDAEDTDMQEEADVPRSKVQAVPSVPPPVSVPIPATTRTIIIPRVDASTLSEWKLVENSKRGLIAAEATREEPKEVFPCELVVDDDEFSLKYELAIEPNYYKVLAYDYLDDATSPDVDIAVSRDDKALNGYTADSPLLPLAEARTLVNMRHHQHKVEHMSLEELARAIDEYLSRDFWQATNNHDNLLASIKAQPAFHRKLFHWPKAQYTATLRQHAVFRAMMSSAGGASEFSFASRLTARFGDNPPAMDIIFATLFPEIPDQEMATHYAALDLLLMIMAPSIYLDPIKIQMLIPPQLRPRRLRYSAFLVWSDITLVFVAQSDVCITFIRHAKIPAHVKSAIQAVKAAVPTSMSVVHASRCCHPRL